MYKKGTLCKFKVSALCLRQRLGLHRGSVPSRVLGPCDLTGSGLGQLMGRSQEGLEQEHPVPRGPSVQEWRDVPVL